LILLREFSKHERVADRIVISPPSAANGPTIRYVNFAGRMS